MPTAFDPLPSPMPGFVVHRNLKALKQLVEAHEELHHGHQLHNRLVVQP